ncbi:hypothetical protein ACSSS7_004623 [Eimeria intestinalis]
MLEAGSLGAGLVAPPSSSAFPVLHVGETPQADASFSLPFLPEAEGPPGALRGLSLRRASLRRGPPAATGMLRLLVCSVAAAAAFLLALCFRKLRTRGGGPQGGPQRRFLAGQQHPWGASGGPPEGEDEEDEEGDNFLSNTLEGCLDMEAEHGFSQLPSEPVPPTETQAIKQIMWTLEDDALLFEVQQQASQQAPTQVPGGQAPPPRFSYLDLILGQEESPWSGFHAWTGDEREAGPSRAPNLPSTLFYQTPHVSPASSSLDSLLQELPIYSSPAAAGEAQAWQQQLPRAQGVEGSPGVGGPQGAGRPLGLWGPQGVGGPLGGAGAQWVAGPAGTPTPPAPSSGAIPKLLSLLQQQQSKRQQEQQEQQQSSSEEAAASGGSETWTASSPEEARSSRSPRAKKRKAKTEDEDKGGVVHPLSKSRRQKGRHGGADPHEQPGPKKPRRKPRSERRTAALKAFKKFSASVEAGASTSGVSASVGHPAASEETSGDTELAQEQPSGSGTSAGFVNVRLITGEMISFAHPPPLPSPDAPRHYRLPYVHPGSIKRQFHLKEALTGIACKNVWPHICAARRLYARSELRRREVKELIIRCQLILRHMLVKYQTSIAHLNPARAKETLCMRFLAFEVLVNAIQLLGPAMNPQEWFPQLVALVPTEFKIHRPALSVVGHHNIHLSELLVEGLREMKLGRRPSLELSTEIKRLLFSPDNKARNIPERALRSWRRALESPEGEDSEDEFTSDED